MPASLLMSNLQAGIQTLSLENYPLKKEPQIRIDIDGVSVPMNPFVQKIFTGTITGMVYSLEGIPENPGCITLSLSRKEKKDENI